MLPRINRLTKKADFENVRQSGKYIATSKLFTVSYTKTEKEAPRFGFIVSKKISLKAHIRNKIKRMLREIIHENLTNIKPGQDFVIVAKPGIVGTSRDKIKAELENVIKTI